MSLNNLRSDWVSWIALNLKNLSAKQNNIEDHLVKRLQAGDSGALGELYDRYGDALYGTALRMLKNEALAEEVVQDSFVKIWKNINSYKDQKSRLFTWMINILRNSAIDKIRSRDFKFTEKSDSIEHFVSIINQQDFTELKVDALGIKDVLKGLPEAQREVIDWIYFGGYTQSEVAKEYGIPLGTVKTRLRSALVVLRKILKVN